MKITNNQITYFILFFCFMVATSLGAVTGMNEDLWKGNTIYNTIISFIVLSGIFSLEIGKAFKTQDKDLEMKKNEQ